MNFLRLIQKGQNLCQHFFCPIYWDTLQCPTDFWHIPLGFSTARTACLMRVLQFSSICFSSFQNHIKAWPELPLTIYCKALYSFYLITKHLLSSNLSFIKYSTSHHQKQSLFYVRSAYPERQGTSSIFLQANPLCRPWKRTRQHRHRGQHKTAAYHCLVPVPLWWTGSIKNYFHVWENGFIIKQWKNRNLKEVTLILYVLHDDDGMWQFLCGNTHETDEAKFVSLKWDFERNFCYDIFCS